MKQVVLASANPGKLKELQTIFAPMNWELHSQAEFTITPVEETGLSFIENAILKARHASKLSNMPALADDSGLVVEALKGNPGIYSARYAGSQGNDKANIDKLLSDMHPIPLHHRQAYFYCAIAYVEHHLSPTPVIAEGTCQGIISQQAIGEEGFGYDPIFFIPKFNLTMAQLPHTVKNKISHRAKAFTQFQRLMSQQ